MRTRTGKGALSAAAIHRTRRVNDAAQFRDEPRAHGQRIVSDAETVGFSCIGVKPTDS